MDGALGGMFEAFVVWWRVEEIGWRRMSDGWRQNIGLSFSRICMCQLLNGEKASLYGVMLHVSHFFLDLELSPQVS